MLVLGVTGQSGAGKGAFCDCFREKGIKCLDTDKTAREVVEKGSECLKILVSHFGEEILLDDGSMNRKRVAEIVFSDERELEFLTETTHKYIIEKMKIWLLERELDGEKIVIIDAPQLFDKGADFYCNFTACVLADREVRVDRIMKRDCIDRQQAEKRIDSQMDDEYFKERCDYVIYNNSTVQKLKKSAEKLYSELMTKEEYF